ncbi:MAG: hypothetical protein WD066_16795 [Planctomycetaceae bacterium]
MGTIPLGASLTGLVIVEQVKSVDFGSRAKFVEKADVQFLDDVLDLIEVCVR